MKNGQRKHSQEMKMLINFLMKNLQNKIIIIKQNNNNIKIKFHKYQNNH